MVHKSFSAADRRKAAPLFAALGDTARLTMIARLARDGPLATIELTKDAGVTRQAITKHLQVLESAGLVTSDRVGRDREWRVQSDKLAAARAYLDQISEQWDMRLARLKAFVEHEGQ